jgi:uncharacterized protein (DUF608 family)
MNISTFGNGRFARCSLILAAFLVAADVRGDDFNPPPLAQLVPADKRLDPAWVKSLTERGEPQVDRGAELAYIGLPIGGLFSGQLYLGGDGRLWHWDIFNEDYFTGWAGHYAPVRPDYKLDEGFALRIGDRTIPLDSTGFSDVSFRGEYPIGTVTYRDAAVPVQVKLEAFSPFIPLDVDDSSLPATIMDFTVTNTSSQTVPVTLTGRLENFVLFRERSAVNGERENHVSTDGRATFLEETITPEIQTMAAPDHVIEDWTKPNYAGWKVEGNAFGPGPIARKALPASFAHIGGDSDFIVNSQLGSPGATMEEKGAATGTLTSAPFAIDRQRLGVWLGGEDNKGRMGVNLLVDGKVVAEIRNRLSHGSTHKLELESVDLTPYRGKQGVLQIFDNATDAGGGISVGRIFESGGDLLNVPFDRVEDNGSMGLALLGGAADESSGDQSAPLADKLVGSLGRKLVLKPGETAHVRFVVSWYFPNLTHLPSLPEQGRSYGAKFSSAQDVAAYIAKNQERLVGDTQLWRKTWYDSTLPYWFLDRTMINTSILATSTCYRLKSGRFWAYEGVGSCNGTCGHVYGYAHALARLFPEIEREQRENVDFAASQHPEGWIDCRGECKGGPAIDAQAYYILRALREHQMSPDGAFLARIWPRVKLAMGYMIAQDGKDDGIIRGAQHNTLDSDWYGEVSWYSGLYQAALRACAEMADLQNDHAYAQRCRRIADKGEAYMAANLFNGEYYQNKVDPAHLAAINSGTGCEIDQVSGQAWAWALGLPRVFPQAETVKSLQSLWKYNYCPDVGVYRAVYKGGRPYADKGEAGVLMCTFPRSDWTFVQASGQGNKGYANYFNECMTGFEHQLAAHMIWEGMVTEGLAIERSIHDRYAPSKRNPYNEVECGDHYGRAMASYGVFLAACGFSYDGPAGAIGFAPRLSPENFKAPFTSAEGWGTYSQTAVAATFTSTLEVKWGRLRVKTIRLSPAFAPNSVSVRAADREIAASLANSVDGAVITLGAETTLSPGQALTITLK